MSKKITLMFDELLPALSTEAYLISFEPGVEVWLPASQCGFEFITGVECIEVPLWLAEDKGLEVYEYE